MTVSLSCQGLRRSFGALTAVDGVDLEVVPGSRHALIGPNGAGKTTLLHLVTGALRVTAGAVRLGEEDVTRLSEVHRARLGISQTMQQASLFPTMSTSDNVLLAVQRRHGRISPLPRRRREQHERVAALLERTGLTGRGDVLVARLSHGERKQLELAVALACEPRLLLLDEPAAGMSPAESARLAELVGELPAEVTVLFVEHDLDLVFQLATTVTVLHLGRVLLTGSPEQVRSSAAVQEAYLGSGRDEPLFTEHAEAG
jgi:branched-chain amino acid transport system ATP-binding protein